MAQCTSPLALAAGLLWPLLLAAADATLPANLINQQTVTLGPASELVVTFPLTTYLKAYGNRPTAVNLTIVGPLQPCQRVIENNVAYCDDYVLTAYLRGGGAPGQPRTVTVPMSSVFAGYLPLEPGQSVVDNTGYLNGVNVMDGFWQAGVPYKSSCAAPTLKSGQYNMQTACLFGSYSVDLHLMVPGQPAGSAGFVVGVPGFPLSHTVLIYLNGPNGSVQAIPQSIVLYQH
jgi:hypothetical protein